MIVHAPGPHNALVRSEDLQVKNGRPGLALVGSAILTNSSKMSQLIEKQ